MRWRRRSDDRGETLIEVVMSMTVMSIAVVALVGGLATAIIMSDMHRKQAKAGAYLRAYTEFIETKMAASPSAYAACGTKATYNAYVYTPSDATFHATVEDVSYWDGTSAFVGSCTTDPGVQKLTLHVYSDNPRAVNEILSLVIRKPCRPITDFPLDGTCS
jgi:Tfp pilus assembly protein PilV